MMTLYASWNGRGWINGRKERDDLMLVFGMVYGEVSLERLGQF